MAVRGGRLSPGGKKEHSESRSAAFALDDKAVGPRLTSYPTHHVIGRIGGTRGFRLHCVQLPTLHLSLASWSVRKSWMPSLVTCQRSQTPGRPTISNLHCTFSVQCVHAVKVKKLHCSWEMAQLSAAILATCHCLKSRNYRVDDRGKSSDYKLIFVRTISHSQKSRNIR